MALSIVAAKPVLTLSATAGLGLFYALEGGIAILQAYVFVLLVSLYLQENT